MEKESNLESLKKDYLEIQKKYNLPDFEKLNSDFQIEKIAEVETDFLVREIRKFVSERFSSYLRFIETLLRPMEAPMFVFSIVKSLGAEEKNILKKAYKKLAQSEVKLIELDIDFVEEKEAEFIKESYVLWQDLKKDLLGIVSVIKDNWDNRVESNGNGKNYFG